MNESNTPAPQGLRYDWTNVPDWVMWQATDANGLVSQFEVRPVLGNWWTNPFAHAGRVEQAKGYDLPPCPDWRDSLEARPTPAETPRPEIAKQSSEAGTASYSETSRCWHPENCNTQKACMAQQKCLAASPSGGAAGGFANGLGISEGIYDHRIMVDRVIVTDWPDAHIVRFKSGAQRFDIGDAWETRDEADAYARLFNAALRNDDLNRRRNANVGWSDLAFLRWVAVDPGYNDEQRAMLERCAAALIGMFPPRLDRDDGARQQGES